MRAIDLIIHGVEQPFAIEKLFIESLTLSSKRKFIDAPISTLTSNIDVEVMGNVVFSAPTLVYIALPDGVYTGVSARYKAGRPIVDNPNLAYQWGNKPLGETLWRWRDIKPFWNNIYLKSEKIKKRRCSRFFTTLSAFPTPENIFNDLMTTYSNLPLPGTAVICETPFLGLPVKSGERLEIELKDDIKNNTITHQFEFKPVV